MLRDLPERLAPARERLELLRDRVEPAVDRREPELVRLRDELRVELLREDPELAACESFFCA